MANMNMTVSGDMDKNITDSIRNKNVDAMIDEIKDIDYDKPAEFGNAFLDTETHFDEQFSPSFYIDTPPNEPTQSILSSSTCLYCLYYLFIVFILFIHCFYIYIIVL